MRCPTCKGNYGNIESHGRKRHPYELEHDAAWIPILVPPDPAQEKRRSVGRERQEMLWESPLPYKADLLIHFEAKSFSQAEDKARDAYDLLRKALPEGVRLDLTGTRENF